VPPSPLGTTSSLIRNVTANPPRPFTSKKQPRPTEIGHLRSTESEPHQVTCRDATKIGERPTEEVDEGFLPAALVKFVM